MITDTVLAIAAHCNLNILHYLPVQGGDINDCYRLQASQNTYFLKINKADHFPGMFEMEADGLAALRNNSSLLVPRVLQWGVWENWQWLLLEWLEKASPKKNWARNFGAALARLHLQPQPYFGWHNNNYIGSLQQLNTPLSDWAAFYTNCRILPMAEKLFSAGNFSKKDLQATALFCADAASLFPAEPAALLHGDCWSGNYLITGAGTAAIFDPAVYYGHREMDLGMTRLFGGFDAAFYEAYNEVYPLEKDWEQRLALTQLYPVLVHAILFGGHYIARARQIVQGYDRQ